MLRVNVPVGVAQARAVARLVPSSSVVRSGRMPPRTTTSVSTAPASPGFRWSSVPPGSFQASRLPTPHQRALVSVAGDYRLDAEPGIVNALSLAASTRRRRERICTKSGSSISFGFRPSSIDPLRVGSVSSAICNASGIPARVGCRRRPSR